MKLGIGSWCYAWTIGVPGHLPEQAMGPFDLLNRAAELGVAVVQVADNLPLDQLSSAELDAFEERAAELNIDVEVGTRGIQPNHLRAYLKLAERFKSPFLRTVIDTAEHQPDEDEVVNIIKEIIPEFEQAGVCLAIENHDRFKAKTLVEIIERIGSDYVGICLDTVNSFAAL